MLILSAFTPATYMPVANKFQGAEEIDVTNNTMKAAADQSNNYTNFQNTTNTTPWTQDQFYFTNDPNIEQNQHIDMPDRLVRYAPDVNDPDLVAWFRFNEGTGTTTYDWKQGLEGIIHGASWATGYIGKALSFDGSNDYVEVDDGDMFNFGSSPFSIEVWIYPIGIKDQKVISKYDGSYGWGIHLLSGGTMEFWMKDPSSTFYVVGGVGYTPYHWYHLVGVYTGTQLIFYVNGMVMGITDGPSSVGSSSQPLFIGKRYSNTEYFHGLIDEIRIYRKELTSEEVWWHYALIFYFDGQKDLLGRTPSNYPDSYTYTQGIFGTAFEKTGFYNPLCFSYDDAMFANPSGETMIYVGSVEFEAGYSWVDVMYCNGRRIEQYGSSTERWWYDASGKSADIYNYHDWAIDAPRDWSVSAYIVNLGDDSYSFMNGTLNGPVDLLNKETGFHNYQYGISLLSTHVRGVVDEAIILREPISPMMAENLWKIAKTYIGGYYTDTEFKATWQIEQDSPETEQGFSEDFSNINEWSVVDSGAISTDGDIINITKATTTNNYGTAKVIISNGIDTTVYPFLEIRVTDYYITSTADSTYGWGVFVKYSDATTQFILLGQRSTGIARVNINEASGGKTIEDLRIFVKDDTSATGSYVLVDWLRVYGFQGAYTSTYDYQADSNSWKTSIGGILEIHHNFDSGYEYCGVKYDIPNIAKSEDVYVEFRVKGDKDGTPFAFYPQGSGYSKWNTWEVGTEWQIIKISLMDALSTSSTELDSFALMLVDHAGTIGEKTGEYILYIDYVRIGYRHESILLNQSDITLDNTDLSYSFNITKAVNITTLPLTIVGLPNQITNGSINVTINDFTTIQQIYATDFEDGYYQTYNIAVNRIFYDEETVNVTITTLSGGGWYYLLSPWGTEYKKGYYNATYGFILNMTFDDITIGQKIFTFDCHTTEEASVSASGNTHLVSYTSDGEYLIITGYHTAGADGKITVHFSVGNYYSDKLEYFMYKFKTNASVSTVQVQDDRGYYFDYINNPTANQWYIQNVSVQATRVMGRLLYNLEVEIYFDSTASSTNFTIHIDYLAGMAIRGYRLDATYDTSTDWWDCWNDETMIWNSNSTIFSFYVLADDEGGTGRDVLTWNKTLPENISTMNHKYFAFRAQGYYFVAFKTTNWYYINGYNERMATIYIDVNALTAGGNISDFAFGTGFGFGNVTTEPGWIWVYYEFFTFSASILSISTVQNVTEATYYNTMQIQVLAEDKNTGQLKDVQCILYNQSDFVIATFNNTIDVEVLNNHSFSVQVQQPLTVEYYTLRVDVSIKNINYTWTRIRAINEFHEIVATTFRLEFQLIYTWNITVVPYGRIDIFINGSKDLSSFGDAAGQYRYIKSFSPNDKIATIEIWVFKGVLKDLVYNQTITIDTTKPTIELISPQSTLLGEGIVTLRWDVRDDTNISLVQIRKNDEAWITLNSDYVYEWNTSNDEGLVSWSIKAYDTSGNMEYKTYYFTVDLTPPTITWISPALGKWEEVTTCKVRVYDSQGIDKVYLQIANGTVYEILPDSSGYYIFEVDPSQYSGAFNITIIAYDLAGNVRIATFEAGVEHPTFWDIFWGTLWTSWNTFQLMLTLISFATAIVGPVITYYLGKRRGRSEAK